MIYKFKDHKFEDYFMEFFITESQEVTFQITDSEAITIDVTISKEQLYDLIGCVLTIQNKLKSSVNKSISL